MIKTIGVAGAGTMGSGIAFVCARHGFKTLLFDVNKTALEKAKSNIQSNINYLVSKQKISSEDGENIFDRINFTDSIKDCIADLFIEAIVEKIDAKVSLFNQLASVNSPEIILATNTSSLSVSLIQNEIPHPGNFVGMHFFNPAPVMKLVEVISGNLTNETTTKAIVDLCDCLGKMPVLCKDSPGFIVNRVARAYYLEAMEIVKNGIADIKDVDAIMEANGFKIGPFRLMDLIGLDINLAVSKSLYDAIPEERLKPADLQISKVQMGELGKKSGKGFYDYTASS
ncbi:MAG: 3-hydroxyacyl-CoA dehydrogenase NAD-binding domain-containing protein [Ferruginibacter sp.]